MHEDTTIFTETSATATIDAPSADLSFDAGITHSTSQEPSSTSLDAESTRGQVEELLRSLESERRRFVSEFTQLLRDSEFEYGYSSAAERYVRERLRGIGPVAREWISRLFVDNFESSCIVSGILRVISHFSYNEVYPQGVTISTAALCHFDRTVKEDAIRAIENWERPELLPLLRTIDVRDEWLRSYVEQVMRDLETED